MDENLNAYSLPVVPMRGIVVFPGTTVSFEAGRDKSIKAVDAAMENDKTLFLTAQEDEAQEKITIDDIYKIGTIAKIKQAMKMPGGAVRLIVEGVERGILREVLTEDPYIQGVVEELDTIEPEYENENNAYCRALKHTFEEYFSVDQRIAPDTYMQITLERSCGKLADKVIGSVACDLALKQEMLETFDDAPRAERTIVIMKNEIQILTLEREIGKKVKQSIDKNQREYYLREQIKAIEEELGDKDGTSADAAKYREMIASYDLEEPVRDKLLKEVDRFLKTPAQSPENSVIRTYLDTVLSLPWDKETQEEHDLTKAQQILDEDHYGLEKVKERIIEYLSVRHFTEGASSILCLVGPPGVGKTSIVKSVARALNKKYVRISLGGIHDEADIRGHRKTYIGSMPGRIVNAVSQAQSKNPVMLLDELDKMGADYKGDPSAALLEVLDREQNKTFRDHYVEVPFDLSQVMFITTANTLDTVSKPLLDRMEVIDLSGYTREEKFQIAKRYLIQKSLKRTGLKGKKLTFADEAIYEMIDYYTRESGVRGLEKQIVSVCRKAAKIFLTEEKKTLKITAKNLKKYLGRRIYSIDLMNEKDEVGVARGLAWTAVGGETLSVEVNVMKGTGKVDLTGKLGDVMKESAKAAISYIRSQSDALGIDGEFYKNKDIHIHVPEGAVPKDGPSAGITMASAAVSALTKVPVRHDVAMTGEVTIRGRVLPIGGLKEKSLAAYRAGIKTIIIPKDNEKDLEEIPENIRREIQFLPVSQMSDVLASALKK